MRRVLRIQRQGKVNEVNPGLATMSAARDVDRTVALIQALIPLGLQAVSEALDAEVTALAGVRYRRTGGQPGSVRLVHATGLGLSAGSETAHHLHAGP